MLSRQVFLGFVLKIKMLMSMISVLMYFNIWARSPAFDRTKIFDHHDLTAKHCYFGCSRSPDVDGIKTLTRPQTIKTKEQCFTAWSSLSKNLIPSTILQIFL